MIWTSISKVDDIHFDQCKSADIAFLACLKGIRDNVKDNQNNVTDDNDDEPLLPTYFFEVNKRFILLKLPFCQKFT